MTGATVARLRAPSSRSAVRAPRVRPGERTTTPGIAPLPRRAAVALAALAAWCAPAAAQQSTLTPTLSVSTSYVDVRDGGGDDDRQFVTEVAPGFTWTRNSGRVQGSISYAFRAIFRSDDRESDSTHNALRGRLRAELIEDWLFVDSTASITQQAVSAFGRQVNDDVLLPNDNRTEVRTWSVAPYVQGQLFGLADYRVRHTVTASDGGSAVDADSLTQTSEVSLFSADRGSVFGWSLVATREDIDFDDTFDSVNDRIVAGVTARFDADLVVGATVGREAFEIEGGGRRSADTWGANVAWTPTPRTTLSAMAERRFFGNSHRLAFNHRFRRSSIVYTDTRGTTNGADSLGYNRGQVQPLTLYELYFELFAPQQPDPVLRDRLVLEYLRLLGLDPSAVVAGAFVQSGVTIQRRQDLAFAVQWPRTTLNLLAYTTRTQPLVTGGVAPDVAPVRQRGASAALSHRLTPTRTLTLSGARQFTASYGALEATALTSAALTLTEQLGARTSLSAALRHNEYTGGDESRESIATATLSMRF